MINSIEIKDPESTPIEWLHKVAAFKTPRRFDFKPGLNVLWGANGSGKTTLLRLLARIFHCEQAGMPVITESSLRSMFDRFGFGFHTDKKPSIMTKAVKIAHDGQGVRHFDPTVVAGIADGQMDWDFSDLGFANTFFKGSAGQTTMFRFDRVLASIVMNEAPKIERKITREHVNSLWQERIDIVDKLLEATAKKGQATVLLDEPERSLDFAGQMTVWRFIRAFAPETQIIVASHSMFALQIPEANYIEFESGFLESSLKAIGKLQTWADEKPSPEPIRAKFQKHIAKQKAEEEKNKAPKKKR